MPLLTDLYLGGPVECVLTWDEQKKLHPFHQNGTPPPKGAIKVTYDSGWETRQFYREQQELIEKTADKPDEQEWLIHWKFRRVVQKWDVQEAKGRPIPLTREAMEPLPPILLRAILDGIDEDMHPKAETPDS